MESFEWSASAGCGASHTVRFTHLHSTCKTITQCGASVVLAPGQVSLQPQD